MSKKDPFRPTDDEARILAKTLMSEARHGSLATMRGSVPSVTRIAVAPTSAGVLTLVSDLAPHTQEMREAPDVSILIGEPGRGDPLAHPRMTLSAKAQFIDKSAIRDAYLSFQPKAALYIDFADFHAVEFHIDGAELNGGFGKAYRLTARDLFG